MNFGLNHSSVIFKDLTVVCKDCLGINFSGLVGINLHTAISFKHSN